MSAAMYAVIILTEEAQASTINNYHETQRDYSWYEKHIEMNNEIEKLSIEKI